MRKYNQYCDFRVIAISKSTYEPGGVDVVDLIADALVRTTVHSVVPPTTPPDIWENKDTSTIVSLNRTRAVGAFNTKRK